MGNSEDPSNILEHRHRKEKKELQAKVMALKKIMKGDKNKKKDITAEICRLESELEEKHRSELERQPSDVSEDEPPPDTVDEIASENIVTGKISKAQKRRDKRAQEERERNERIKQQEKENLQGPRTLETLEITSKLKEAGLAMQLIPSDGDCLYKAISHQLEVTGRKVLQVQELRTATSSYVRENKEDFLPFMSNPETLEMLTDGEFEEYCNAIANTKTWGGQMEIQALSHVLKCPIHVMQAGGQDAVRQGEEMDGAPLIVTYHRHMYSLGEHYNSTIKSTSCT